jgi:hypothetical protein
MLHESQDRPVIVTFRDDQLRHDIQPMSPTKNYRNLSYERNNRLYDYNGRLPSTGLYYPPRMGGVSHANHSSAAALARKSSYPNLTPTPRGTAERPTIGKKNALGGFESQSASLRYLSASSCKENLPPSQSCVPTMFRSANRIPTPDPFAPTISQMNSSNTMRDEPLLFSEYLKYNSGQASVLSNIHNKHGAAHMPSNTGTIKSRKEGLTHKSPHLLQSGIRHDQNLLPSMHRGPNTIQKLAQSTPVLPPKSTPAVIEIIDVDAIDPSLDDEPPLGNTKLTPFIPSHKLGMSSIDSTGRVERNLYSALGPKYGGLETRVESTTNAEPLLTQNDSSDLGADMLLKASPEAFEPAAKRKRQSVFDEEGKESPVSKRERGSQGEVDPEEEDMLRTKLGSE